MQLTKKKSFKALSLLIISLFLISLISPLILAETPLIDLDNPEETAKKIESIGDTFVDEEDRTQYLKKAWANFIEDTPFGKAAGAVIWLLNPIFRLLFKQELTFSLLFLFTVIIWFVLVTLLRIIYHTAEIVISFVKRNTITMQDKSTEINWAILKLPSYIVAIAAIILASLTPLPKYLAKMLVHLIDRIEQDQILELLIILFIIISLILLSQYLERLLKKFTKRKKEIEFLDKARDRRIRDYNQQQQRDESAEKLFKAVVREVRKRKSKS